MSRRPRKGGVRRGAGRPRALDGTRSVTMGLVMGDRLAEDVRLAAAEMGITKGELLRRAAAREAREVLTKRQQPVTIHGERGGRRGKKRIA
jgi:hypothetical protein